MDLQTIRNAIEAVLKIIAEREYAISTFNNQRSVLNSLLKFMKKNNFTELNEEIAMAFVKQQTGEEMDRLVMGTFRPQNKQASEAGTECTILPKTWRFNFFYASPYPAICLSSSF